MSDLFGRAVLVAIFSSLATLKALVVFDFAWSRFPTDEIHIQLDFASQLAGLAFMIFITSAGDMSFGSTVRFFTSVGIQVSWSGGAVVDSAGAA